MKSLVVIASILLLSTAAPRAAVQTGKSAIEGIVVRAGDNSPIAGAHVKLVPDEPMGHGNSAGCPADGFPEEYAAFSATTDDQGKFAFVVVDSQLEYRMLVNSNGYVRHEYGQQTYPGIGRLISFKSGQTLKDIHITLTPTGSVEGTVRAVSGEPLQDVQVRLMRYVFTRDGSRHLQMVTSTTTNDLGRYRLFFLTPGRYYLNAERINMEADYVLHSLAAYAPLFYPGESDISRASIIDIQPGTNRSGLDFSLSGNRLYRIRGQMVDGRTGHAIADGGALLSLFDLSPGALPGGACGSYGGALIKSTNTEDSGTFDFVNIPPGKYVLAGSSSGDEGGLATIRVADDVLNVKLPVGPGTTISGTLRGDGRMDLSGLEIALRPAEATDDGDELAQAADLSPEFESISDRSFKIRNIYAGDYRLDVLHSDLPDDTYIKEARYGGTDALNQSFHISDSDSRKLEIIIGKAGNIEGRVTNDMHMPSARITTVLIPNRLRSRADLYKTDLSGDGGRFEMHGIAPGDYKLFAWEAIETWSWFDPEVIRPFEASGQPVHISEASTQSVEIKLIPFAP